MEDKKKNMGKRSGQFDKKDEGLTLLEKAMGRTSRSKAPRIHVTKEHAEIIQAYFTGKITCEQFAFAIDKPRSNAYSVSIGMLKECLSAGILKLVLKGNEDEE